MKLNRWAFIRGKRAEVATGEFPVEEGSPTIAWPKVKQSITALLVARPKMDFKIGRTNNPEHRDSGHQSDELIEVYRTDSLDEVMEMETIAIRTFIDWEGCQNGPEDSRGNSGPGVQSVYVAFWERR